MTFTDLGAEILWRPDGGTDWIPLTGTVASVTSLFADVEHAAIKTTHSLLNFSWTWTGAWYRTPTSRRARRLEQIAREDVFWPGQRERLSALHSQYRRKSRGHR